MSGAVFAGKKSPVTSLRNITADKSAGTRLRIGEPDDAYEREADRVAEAVLSDRRAPSWSISNVEMGSVQRQIRPTGHPTKAMITFSYKPKGDEKTSKQTESGRYRAETARIAAEQEKFRARIKYKPGSAEDLQQKAEQRAIDDYTLHSFGALPGTGHWPLVPSPSAQQSSPDAGLRLPSFESPFQPKPFHLLDRELDLQALTSSSAPKDDEKKKQKAAPIQRKAKSAVDSGADDGFTQARAAPPIVHEVLQSPGQPLDASTRRFFEPRFGLNLTDICIHTGARAAESAQAVDALAYTVGTQLVFDAGQYAPGTHAGAKLLAHEIAHSIQQQAPGALLQREPTRPRAATASQSVSDVSTQTASPAGNKVTAGSLARQEWESLFKRHFTEPDQVADEVESSHARYLFSRIYGWIDAQHFFAHIQFAEDSGLEAATTTGISIEQRQQAVRKLIGPVPGEEEENIYPMLLKENLITPEAFIHYRETTFMAISAALSLVLSPQQQALVQGFSDEQIAKLILDNAMSAWSYEDLVSNQLGIQFFKLYGADVNAGVDAENVRKRFIEKITEFFGAIQVVDDPSTVKRLAGKLPGRERWTAPKLNEAQARKKFPELFEFKDRSHRIRIAVYDLLTKAEKGKSEVEKQTSAALPPGLNLTIEPFGGRFALFTGPMSRFEAVVYKFLIDHAVQTGPGGALIQPVSSP